VGAVPLNLGVQTAPGFARVHLEDDPELLEVVGATCAAGRLPRASEGGQQDGREDANDGDHHQKLDKSKAGSFAHGLDSSPDGSRQRRA
jgi:hypothetical protein